MQTVVDFLLEYYVWVLIVLVILLITVVGFLADTKKKKKLREKKEREAASDNSMPTNDLNMMNQGMDMNYNAMNQNMNMGYNDMNNNMMNPNTDNMMNNNMMMNNQINSMPNNMVQNMNGGMDHNVNMMNNMSNGVETAPSAMESIPEVNSNLSSNDSFFIPASEQTPKFEPREVSIPKPVEPTPILNNGINNNVASVTEPREVSSMSNNIPNSMSNVVPQMTVPTPEPMQNSIPEVSNPVGVQMGGVTPTPIPNAMPQMTAPSAIPNVNVTATPVAEPMTQMNNMPNNMVNNIPNGVPNPMPNMNQVPPQPQVNNMGGYNNNSVQGGANFVMNGTVQNNQNNGNWNL